MKEILSALKPKEKLAIASSMAGFALVLASVLIAFSFCSTSRHEHQFDYHLQLEDGKFNLVGYCTADGCPAPDYVERDVQGVTLTSAQSPTCAKEGKRVYTYRNGNADLQYVQNISKCAHKYNCDDISIENGCVTIECTQQGCPEPTLTLENVTSLWVEQYVEGDCFISRQVVYGYTANGSSGNFVTLLDESRPHTLSGKSADTLENADGTYTYGQSAVKIIDLSGAAACGSVSDGYYICEKCAQVVLVKVKKPDHALAYDSSAVIEPTALEAGSVDAHCSNEGCSYTETVALPEIVIGLNAVVISEATEDTPMQVRYTYTHPLGLAVELNISIGTPVIHNYTYKLELAPSGESGYAQFNLIGTCDDPDCPKPTVVFENVPVTASDALCTDNKIVYKYEKNGVVCSIDFPKVSKNHTFSYDVADVVYPTESAAGEIDVECSSRDCQYCDTVTLPKVEYGVNAEIIGETSSQKSIKYSYETENGFTITLLFIINK